MLISRHSRPSVLRLWTTRSNREGGRVEIGNLERPDDARTPELTRHKFPIDSVYV